MIATISPAPTTVMSTTPLTGPSAGDGMGPVSCQAEPFQRSIEYAPWLFVALFQITVQASSDTRDRTPPSIPLTPGGSGVSVQPEPVHRYRKVVSPTTCLAQTPAGPALMVAAPGFGIAILRNTVPSNRPT